MGREGNMPQREEKKSPEKELNEMKASNLSHTEFKAVIIMMYNNMKKNLT